MSTFARRFTVYIPEDWRLSSSDRFRFDLLVRNRTSTLGVLIALVKACPHLQDLIFTDARLIKTKVLLELDSEQNNRRKLNIDNISLEYPIESIYTQLTISTN